VGSLRLLPEGAPLLSCHHNYGKNINIENMAIEYHSKSRMISRRQEGGDDAYYTYVEEADDDANIDNALI
jgi:hypothetical protein